MRRLIAVDWGSTSLRAYLLDHDGTVLDQRASAEGMTTQTGASYPATLDRATAGWTGTIVLAGMVGSRQGWVEAPYCRLPAAAADLAAAAIVVPGTEIRIIPGLSQSAPADVLRGEEVQVLGALAEQGEQSGRFCLPGTHSKWITVEDGRMTRFHTALTGELYAVVRDHTLIGRLFEGEADDAACFAAGVVQSGQGTSLLTDLFGVRARGLLGDLPVTGLASYLSGLLIGHEVRAAGVEGEVTVIGADGLVRRYRQAASQLGLVCRPGPAAAAAAGMHAVANAGGWL